MVPGLRSRYRPPFFIIFWIRFLEQNIDCNVGGGSKGIFRDYEFSTSLVEVPYNPPEVEPNNFVPKQTNPELVEIYIVKLKGHGQRGGSTWQRLPKATFDQMSQATYLRSLFRKFKKSLSIFFKFKFDDDQLRVVNENDDVFARYLLQRLLFLGEDYFLTLKFLTQFF